mgnify:CR=1 FL=1
MKCQRFFIKVLFLATAGIFLTSAASARPRANVKSTTIREENPKGIKSALVLPYAFSTDSLGFTDEGASAYAMFGQPF